MQWESINYAQSNFFDETKADNLEKKKKTDTKSSEFS